MSQRVTPQHYRWFRGECMRLIDKLGVSGWTVDCVHEQLHPDSRLAQCATHWKHRNITLSLTRTVESNVALTRERILQSARHEVAHALLAPMASLAGSRYVTEDETYAAEEETVCRLMAVLEHL